jgi:hypothetical protein
LEVVAEFVETLVTVATPELSEANVNVPELSDVGAVRENDASNNSYRPALGPRVNGPNVGSIDDIK